MTIIILAALTIITFTVFLPARRRLPIRKYRLPISLLGAALVAVGAILSAVNLARLDTYLETRSWPATAGKIVRTAVVREGRVYAPLIVYRYQVSGRAFVDSSHAGAPGFGGKRKRFDAAERILSEYHQDSLITVRYDPSEPSTSTLHPGPPWNVYGQLGLGATLFSAGLFLLLLIVFGRR